MVRKLPDNISFDEAEDEIMFTMSAMKADPDAEDLAPATDGWQKMVDDARQKERAARLAIATTDAFRIVVNGRFDKACEAFADELYLAVGKDRAASRWIKFLTLPVSQFVRQALSRQVATVRSWLGSTDPVLERHRDELKLWSEKADQAVVATRGTALLRGEAREMRAELAHDLTRERDGLRDALAQRARERGLPRDWPDLFFRTAPRRGATDEAEVEAPPTSPTPAA